MKDFFKKEQSKAPYFAEIQPIVKKRLAPLLLILITAFAISTFTGLFVAMSISKQQLPETVQQMHWLNFLIMLFTVAGVAYALFQLRKDKIRQTINFLLISVTASIILQAFTNGGIGEPPLIIYPLLIMTAGFFSNISMMRLIKWSCAVSVILLYLVGVLGFKPLDISEKHPDEVFIRLDQMIYCLLIIEVCYQAIKMFINDYGTILSRVKADQKALDFIAYHDKLTQLPNRHACEANFERLFRHSATNDDKANLLLFIDIDNFKNINTRFGHNGGDEALIKVAENLKQTFNCKDTIVSRIGGDEFIVMIRISPQNIESRLNEAMKLLALPLTIFDQTEYVSCSMGVVEVKSNSSTFKDEYRKADLAMNRAKKTGKNRYCYFDQTINDMALKDIEIGAGLFEAIKNNEFALFYQPQVDLKSGKIIGAEALIRWITHTGKVISPAEFIPIAEKNGSILEMTHWVIRQSCLDCARWHREGYTDMFVSVNVSSNVLSEGNLPEIIKTECEKSGLNPKYLEVELTESMILENGDDIIQQLKDMRNMGVSLAIDDFGTGYSNLSYLSRLNVQKLKVDQYFVMNLAKSEPDKTIVQAVAQIAKSFGMKTVAEGVEVAEMVKPLRDLNCNIGQGYFWSKPEPLDTFIKLLGNHNNLKTV